MRTRVTLIVGTMALALCACGDDGTGSEAVDAGTQTIDATGEGVDASALCQDVSCEQGTCVDATGECDCDDGWEGATCNTVIQPPDGNLLFHLDGNDTNGNGTQSPLGPLDVWVDKKAAVSNFLQTGDERPTVVAGPNGLHMVSFDGDDWMPSGSTFGGIKDKFAYTVIVVGRGQTNDNAFIAGTETTNNDPGLLIETTTGNNLRALHRMPFGTSGGDDIITATATVKGDALNRLWFTRNSTNYGIKINDELTLVDTGAAVDFDQDLDIAIGRESIVTDSRYLTGEIAEVLIYLGEQSPNNNAALEAYLQAKWGVE